jgi:metal-responsive CopG/Arc/MetJ family transcriptional regulator
MPTKRVLISIDPHLLARIDEACARREVTRSGYLARLAAADLDEEARSIRHPTRDELGYG